MLDDELKKKIMGQYQTSKNSIQDIARINRVTVEEVLDIIGEGDAKQVYNTGSGDLIDQEEAGEIPVSGGKTFKSKFSTD